MVKGATKSSRRKKRRSFAKWPKRRIVVALEFKEARPKDSLKFVKTVVAFANGRGGRILFGVADKT